MSEEQDAWAAIVGEALEYNTKERHLLIIDTNQFTYICNNQNNKVAYCLCWQAKVEEEDEGDDQEL